MLLHHSDICHSFYCYDYQYDDLLQVSAKYTSLWNSWGMCEILIAETFEKSCMRAKLFIPPCVHRHDPILRTVISANPIQGRNRSPLLVEKKEKEEASYKKFMAFCMI